MKIMVVGGGGREHAIIKKLKENSSVEVIYALPGNGGIAADAVCVNIGAKEIDRIVEFALENKIDFAVVAPDDPLVLGAVDALEEKGIKCFGTFKFPFGKVRLTLAFHGSGIPGGHACGFVVDFYDTKFYFAGDTALFGDMQLLPQLDAFDYAILPIGGNFTMDPKDAAIAAKFLAAKYVIPVHYNTWPPIAQDVEAYKADVEANTASKVLIVKPGETIELE